MYTKFHLNITALVVFEIFEIFGMVNAQSRMFVQHKLQKAVKHLLWDYLRKVNLKKYFSYMERYMEEYIIYY